MTIKARTPKLLITDLDNTLYDWFGYFVPSVYCMIDRASEILRVPRQELIQELRKVHQRHHDVEHPFALLETSTATRLIEETSFSAVADLLDPAFHEFNKARICHLRLYPNVHHTLEDIRRRGVFLVAYSESKKHAIVDRLRRLRLLDLFDRVYCRESSRSLHPNPRRAKEISAGYPRHKLVEQPREARKPAPEVLLSICEREGIDPKDAAYVGDSRVKDILMANRAGVLAVWAKYGDLASRDDYDRLVAISHWTEEDIKRERALQSAESSSPDLILERSFSEIKKLFPRAPWWRRLLPRKSVLGRKPVRETRSTAEVPVTAVGDPG